MEIHILFMASCLSAMNVETFSSKFYSLLWNNGHQCPFRNILQTIPMKLNQYQYTANTTEGTKWVKSWKCLIVSCKYEAERRQGGRCPFLCRKIWHQNPMFLQRKNSTCRCFTLISDENINGEHSYIVWWGQRGKGSKSSLWYNLSINEQKQK